ncbi:MAG TPA: NADH-quinone oxidoreductase subunit NuoN [Egibacteraceae bacterium]|nr:NADH-quinone oxidoreductase subunit NuoN [Egibacteraceae bacterium]
MHTLAQAGVTIPDIPWAAISPELVLFGFGILVLLLDTAGGQRLQASFVALGLLGAGAGYAAYATGETRLPGLVGLAAVTQFALTWIWRDRPRRLGALLAAIGFAAGLGVTAWQWGAHAGGPLIATQSLLGDMVAVDGVALFTRFTVCLVGIVAVPLGFSYMEERRIHRGEFYPLLLFAATGMTLLASAADLIMVFISIEVLSLSLYILSGFAKRDLNSQESAIKYFLLGAFSSALLLYGIALVYGLTGSTNIAQAGQAFRSIAAPDGMVLAAMALLLVGLGFKVSLVPFHMWTPDVYQGAPTPITGFMAAAVKAAAFAAFLRVFVGAFAELAWSWVPVFWVIAALTMMAGAILAVVQTDLKRMLGYSAVAHAGYALIGVIAVSREGVSATLFYLLVYALMSLGAFGVLTLLERRNRKALALSDLRGLGRRYPVPAGMFGLFLLSLAGIPGTAGFMGKLAVFRAGVDAGHVALVVLAVVSSLIAAFFYIRVIVTMFMEDEPAEVADQPPLVATTGLSAGLAAAASGVVVLGILPGVLIDLARQAASFAG